MAEKKLNTRIALKIDTLEAWESSSLPLKKGEVALATTTHGSKNIVLMKVADTEGQVWSAIPDFVYARAADVLDVCKDANDLTAFINNLINAANFTDNDAFKALEQDVSDNADAIEVLNGTVDTAGSVAKAIKDAIDALDLANTYAAKEHDHVVADITDFDTAVKAYGYALDSELDAVAEDLGEEVTRATQAEEALAGRVKTLEDSKDAYVAADTALKTELAASIKSTDDKITAFLKDADMTEKAVDTLAELQNYITTHGNEASGMLEDIAANTKAIGDEVTRATGAEEALAGRVKTLEDHKDDYVGADTALKSELEGKINAIDNHSHENKTVLDGITAEKVSAWDAAEKNAKDYADGLADNYDAAGSAADALQDAKDYADGLAGNYDAAGSAADALADAKEYADGLKTTIDAAYAAADTATLNSAKAYADGLAGNYDAAGSAADALQDAKDYADGLAGNYATAAQGTKADTALQKIETTANGGLVVTNNNKIDIDDTVTFVFDCGNATV